ncbi:putative ABC transport system substrate-binding protein [Pseudoalteromonas denitrificans DSM 6059]|uniref:Putative ABC transport system substrate-binding protein n=1 Tax=Pseudoalteromonas denitrificans DSM 6059 TaxID=1123010 RepID=A0A1I1RQB4_9GAMM|nr:putative ABC transport system substrate-binding protein [Pseudoalteromonas denitrificans DSM 6059]
MLYPEARAPYNLIFQQIINGIQAEHKLQLVTYPLKKNYDPEQLLAQLSSDNIEMVITLGRRGFLMADLLMNKIPFVSGALPLKPNGISGVSLIADPDSLLTKLLELAPNTKNIHVIYSPVNQWLIDLAHYAAKQRQLSLKSYKVNDLSDAIKTYKQVINNANSKTDALWLPLDKITSNERVVLPLVLEKSWKNKLLLFSSKPSHAKRGTLFSVFPNNEGSGERLVQMVKQLYFQKTKPGVEPMKSNKLGVNLRTAGHLGLKYSSIQLKTFSATFPIPE